MNECSHVVLASTPCKWKRPKHTDETGYVSRSVTTKVIFDDFHQEVVLLRGSPTKRIFVSCKQDRTWKEYPIALQSSDALSGKLSPDKSHFALRVSLQEVKVLETTKGTVVTARSCGSTSGATMMQVHWLKGDLLLFVTNNGVELYLLKNKKLKHVKTSRYSVKYHWFLHQHNVLLLVDDKNVFQAYHLSRKAIAKICHFSLDCDNTSFNQITKGVRFLPHQISLWSLYGRVVCAFVNERAGKLHLLGLNSDSMEILHEYSLLLSAIYAVSAIDNVLVVHNVRARVSLLFDIQTDGKTSITAPLTIGSSPDEAPQKLHYDRWKFEAPNFIIDSKPDYSNGTLYTMNLNYAQIAHSWTAATRFQLLGFLHHRSTREAKLLILSIIRQTIESGPLILLSRIFSRLARINQQAVEADAAAGLQASSTSSTTGSSSTHSASSSTVRSAEGDIGEFAPLFEWDDPVAQTVAKQKDDMEDWVGSLLHNKYAKVDWDVISDGLLQMLGERTNEAFQDRAQRLEASLRTVRDALIAMGPTHEQRASYTARNEQLKEQQTLQTPNPGSAFYRELEIYLGMRLLSGLLASRTSVASNAASVVAFVSGGGSDTTHRTSLSALDKLPDGLVSKAMRLAEVTARRTTLRFLAQLPAEPMAMARLTAKLMFRILIEGAANQWVGSSEQRVGLLVGQFRAVDLSSEEPVFPRAPHEGNPESLLSAGKKDPPARALPAVGGAEGAVYKNEGDDGELSFNKDWARSIPELNRPDVVFSKNGFIVVTQEEMCAGVFGIAKLRKCPPSVLIPAMVEYMRCINNCRLHVASQLNELLVTLLIEGERYYEFHQYLQYHVLNDSRLIADRLLGLSAAYPAAYQLGLDMLYRLKEVTPLLQVLLDHKEVIVALRLVSHSSRLFQERGLHPRDFLQTAWSTGDRNVFYSTYKFFEARNLSLRGDIAFTPEERCEDMVHRYTSLFGEDAEEEESGSSDDEAIEEDREQAAKDEADERAKALQHLNELRRTEQLVRDHREKEEEEVRQAERDGGKEQE